jgi:hypothetical protein
MGVQAPLFEVVQQMVGSVHAHMPQVPIIASLADVFRRTGRSTATAVRDVSSAGKEAVASFEDVALVSGQ